MDLTSQWPRRGCIHGVHLFIAALLMPLMLSFHPCDAIFEDQVGLWDWHQQYIGRVTHAVFQTQGTGRKRVIVATEQNVIACLNLRRGEIIWRHVLGESDTIQGLDILSKYVITLSGDGSIVRAWHLPDGQLVWETYFDTSSPSSVLILTQIEANNIRAKLIVVFGGGILHGISSADGNVLWTTDTTIVRGELTLEKVLVSPDKTRLYGVGFAGTSGFSLWDISSGTGHVSLQHAAKMQGCISTGQLVVTKQTAIAVDPKGETILVGYIGPEQSFELYHTPIHAILPDASGQAQLLNTDLEGVFVLNFSHEIALVMIGLSDHELQVLEKFEQPAIVSHSLELPGNKSALVVIEHVGYPVNQKVALRIVLMDGNKFETSSELVDRETERGVVERVYLNAYVRTDRSYGFRALVVAEDHSLSLLQQGEVVWSREDGLASVIDTSTAELPLEKEGVSVAKVEHSLIESLKRHFLKLKATLILASPEEMAAVQALRLNIAERSKMTRDHNAFRKLLVVLTKAGKLFALHTGDGRIIWSLLIPAFRNYPGMQKAVMKLFPWQIPHRHALDENPVVLVVGKCGMGPNAEGMLSWVDAYTGKELRFAKLTYSVDQVIPLPKSDSSEQRLHLIVDNNANVHLFPETNESLGIFLDEMHNTHFFIVNKDNGIITGYGVEGPEEVSSGTEKMDGLPFKTEKLWTVVFPNESERIVTTATRKQDEVVHTQAKVLTNQDVWYKYLNKNVIFVATVASGGSGMIGGVSPEETWLVAYVIDTVTGRILHRVKHANMQGPVHAVFSENWVVYHYFNLRTHRYEMSVLEIYDKNRVDNKNIANLMLGKHNATAPISSYSYPDLDIKSQSYLFTHSVKKMTVTYTAHGITAKQVLLGTIGDQVLALDKRFFDPRRTSNPTAAEREDGIIPLTDSLPIYPQSYLTHAYQVEGLRGILTIPASLESTSLVFAYGVDLFFTHTTPSRTYDSLTEDFSYALLLITIAALLIAIIVTWLLSERKELKERWK